MELCWGSYLPFEVMAQQLGYLLLGPLPVYQSPLSDNNVFHISIQNRELRDDMNFWKIEIAGTKGGYS